MAPSIPSLTKTQQQKVRRLLSRAPEGMPPCNCPKRFSRMKALELLENSRIRATQVQDSNFEKLAATRRRMEFLQEGNASILHKAMATNVLQVSSEQIDEANKWVEELHTEGMELARKAEEAHDFIRKVQTAIIQLCEE